MNKEKILYVDDELINLELFKVNFESDYEVFTAISGQKGLDVLKTERNISIIFSDLKMPIMNGMEFISKVKAKYPEKTCIILTAYTETEEIRKGLNDELIFRYLLKPWNREVIVKVINQALQRV